MSNETNPEQEIMGLMEDLDEMLRAEVLPTHLPLVQLIYKLCEDPALKQVDLYSKYTRLAAVVGGDWITVKEELRNATRFGAPAFYCSISAMHAVFTCRRSRSHDELVNSLTELYNHISAGNVILNKQVEHAITTMGKQVEHANEAEARIANIVEQAENAVTTIREQVNKTEVNMANVIERADHTINTIANQLKRTNISEISESIPSSTASESPIEIRQDNKDIVPIPGTTFRCEYGTVTFDDQSKFVFNGSGLEAKSLALWFTLPIPIEYQTKIMNLDHNLLIRMTAKNLLMLNKFKLDYNSSQKKSSIHSLLATMKYKAGQWSCIS